MYFSTVRVNLSHLEGRTILTKTDAVEGLGKDLGLKQNVAGNTNSAVDASGGTEAPTKRGASLKKQRPRKHYVTPETMKRCLLDYQLYPHLFLQMQGGSQPIVFLLQNVSNDNLLLTCCGPRE